MTILVGTDFSSGGDSAVHYRSVIAQAENAELLVVYVKTGCVLPHGDEDVADPGEPQIRRQLETTAFDVPKVACRRLLLRGNPPDEILKVAADEQVDLIVIGTHGQTGSSAVPMGAIAQTIVSRAPCTVMAIAPANRVRSNSTQELTQRVLINFQSCRGYATGYGARRPESEGKTRVARIAI